MANAMRAAQLRYDHRSPPEETPRERVEQLVRDKLCELDPETVDGFAEHCEIWLSDERRVMQALLRAVINTPASRWALLMPSIYSASPDMANALCKLAGHVDAQQVDFIQSEADRLQGL